MKVTVERAELLKSLSHVHRVVERRNTIPILANVLIRAERSKLAFKATDLDLEVIETIGAEVSPGGVTTVPAHMFYEIVRKLPEGTQIVLEASGDRAVLTIRAGRSRFTLQTLPESDFPDIAAGDMSHKFTIAAADLKRLIEKTQFAISTEETRYYLNGIYLHTVGTGKSVSLRAVATDGHRLAQVDLAAPAGANGMPGIIVPRKTVNEVQRLIDDVNGEVAVELSTAKIRFTLGTVVLTSKLIDGTFPEYGRVIPLGNNNGALRLTTARYYTPSGKSIQAKGIVPDIEVLQDVPEELKARTDTKGEASLRGHLKAEGDEQTGSQSYIPPDAKDDKALRMAVDLLRGSATNAAFPPDAKRAVPN